MLAYLSWHRPAAGVDAPAYESALEGFHRSLAHRPPSGFEGSCAFRAAELPWLATVAQDPPGSRAGYEDWYLLDDWAALGVLEEAAVAHGHVSLHDRVASLSGDATSAVYRLIEGCSDVAKATVAVWVSRPPGHDHPSLAALLGDGMDPAAGGLWRRCVGLGPAPELCLLAREAPAGVASGRLPHGWTASAFERVALWQR
jgi:hypothetical protein